MSLIREDANLKGILVSLADGPSGHMLTSYHMCDMYPARGRGPTASSNNGQQSNHRQRACIYCQQMGHSSSDCPSHFSGSRNAHVNGMNPQSGMTAEVLFSHHFL